MKVPQLDQSVGIDAINAPSIKAPDAVEGAFGGQVASAMKGAGDAGLQLATQLSNHIKQENLWRGQAQIADSELKLRGQFQNLATSTDPKVKLTPGTAPSNVAPAATMGPQVLEQPKGYLNRVGFSAVGSTKEFLEESKPIFEQSLEPFKNNPQLYAMAKKQFTTALNAYYNQVSAHEATQYRAGMNNTFNAQTVSTITQTSAANDPASLLAGIESVKNATTQQFQYKGALQEEIDNHIATNVADAVSKSVVNKLSSTGDLASAKAMLDAAKETIPVDRYQKIDEMLTTGNTRMQQQAHVATVQKTINGQANLLTSLAGGTAGWMNLDDVTNLVKMGTISEKFGKAYSDVLAAKGNYQPQQANNENVPKFIDSIYNAKDQTQLHDVLISMMQEHKDMGQDEMAILINSAMKRSGSLPLDNKLGTSAKADPKQQNIDAGARAVVNFGKRNGLTPDEIGFVYSNYFNNASKGMAIPQAIDQATRQYAVAKFPAVATMEGTPHAIATPNSGVKYLNFNSNVTVAPSRIFNSKTGQFEVNTNKAKTSGGKKEEAK